VANDLVSLSVWLLQFPSLIVGFILERPPGGGGPGISISIEIERTVVIFFGSGAIVNVLGGLAMLANLVAEGWTLFFFATLLNYAAVAILMRGRFQPTVEPRRFAPPPSGP